MDMIHLTIDGIPVSVPVNTTVLEAARSVNIHIPTLCYLKDVNAIGACRICVVEVKGARQLQAACVLPVSEGMAVSTNSPAVREARKVNMELILSNHDRSCLTCVRNQNCELQKLSEELGIRDIRFEGKSLMREKDLSSPSIVRDPNKCILCRRCVATCQQVQKVGAIGATNRGYNTIVEPAFELDLSQTPCINCGQCITACPVGALTEKDDTERVWNALHNPDLHVMVQTAPAIRVALGEEFGMPMGTRVTGKMTSALRKMGFDKVFDTDFGADLTIMEEGTEFINRLKNGGKLPMITSCSPGWIKYCEHFFPDFLDNLSTCKSPHEMLGAVLKNIYAKQHGLDPKKMVVVSIMPCTAKKFEAQRPEMSTTGTPDVDIVLTTRELARMIKEANIDFASLPDEDFDAFYGDSTGAAVIFGATGGVMEAALRTVYEVLTGKELPSVEFEAVRGIAGVKEATVQVGDIPVKVAVVNGTGNAQKLLEAIRGGEKEYHFIEVMGCPGGCVTGGGQPIVPAGKKMDVDPRVVRAQGLYDEDREMVLRKSHHNPSIQRLYKESLGEPNGHLSHELLHTHYQQRDKY